MLGCWFQTEALISEKCRGCERKGATSTARLSSVWGQAAALPLLPPPPVPVEASASEPRLGTGEWKLLVGVAWLWLFTEKSGGACLPRGGPVICECDWKGVADAWKRYEYWSKR